MSSLTTHVLDTAHGRPAAGLRLALFRLADDGTRIALLQAVTNADGRCDGPLLAGSEFQSGVYELDFHAADYFRACGVAVTEPPFLDRVTLRFGLAAAGGHYHVPLLLSPWSYATYRGS